VAEIRTLALETEARMRDVMVRSADDPGLNRPFELQGAQDMFAMKPQYREKALALKLPQFFEDADAGLFNDGDASRKWISKAALLKSFKLSQQASDLTLDGSSPDAYKVEIVSYESGEAARGIRPVDRNELGRHSRVF
jgi:hypothetical protein